MRDQLYRILSYCFSRPLFQRWFAFSAKLSLFGMNYHEGVKPEWRGEYRLLRDIRKKHGNQESLVIFDVGANIGEYALLVAKAFQDIPTEIHAFEPSAATFQKLVHNTQNYKNIHCWNFGFGQTASNAKLFSTEPLSVRASLFTGDSTLQLQSEDVKITTLDAFCQEHGIQRIDFLKIDTEGSEYDVLQGARNLLVDGKVSALQFEFGEFNIRSKKFFIDFFHLLQPHYRIYQILVHGLRPIRQYSDREEVFLTANYYAERVS